MTIVLLAAGTSSRMGERNKMILPYKGVPMVAHCCNQALLFLNSLKDETSHHELMVVTGYMKEKVEAVLQDHVNGIVNVHSDNFSKSPSKVQNVTIKIVHNENFEKGQYSSTVCAVSQIQDNEDFFISLADMPFITALNYKTLVPLLENYDAVRPFVTACATFGHDEINGKIHNNNEKKPGHPVFLSHKLKKAIVGNPNIGSVNRLLKDYNVREVLFNDTSWTFDIDTPNVYDTILSI